MPKRMWPSIRIHIDLYWSNFYFSDHFKFEHHIDWWSNWAFKRVE